MGEIKIIEYQRKYAAQLAKMWNMSADSWGGFDSLETEESVIQDNEDSENIKAWLALDGEEVVGYCSFSEYREDKGASYIPLLNVRTDYHGKGVGKFLVLKAVEEACKHPWPRLDLYTWPGNTKAVPLYKKCGFCWEDRDDSTHLMNFIPYIIQTEAAADFFLEADWYVDSVREIEVEPDGRQENGFEYYEYEWQHGQRMLRMEFERRGRGLRLMETEDWLVEATVEDLNLAFGRSYSVVYRLVNKTGKPLQVAIQGKDDANIIFALERTVTVQDETEVKGQFQVGEINEEQNSWRTHPGVYAEILVNGKKAEFKVGVVPKYPALVKAVVPDKECYAGYTSVFFLNVENGFNEPAHFQFTLPQADFIQLGHGKIDLSLENGEKKAVPVPFSLKGLGLLTGPVSITARPRGGGVIEYQSTLYAAFAGPGVGFSGEGEKNWFVVNGRYSLVLQKFNNVMEVGPLIPRPYSSVHFMRPQVGLPYSVEFAKARPVAVEQGVEDGIAFIKATYVSESRPGLEIQRRAYLQADGLAWQEWKLRNTGEKFISSLHFRTMVRASLREAVVPLAGKILEARDGYGEHIANFPLSHLTENWVYSQVNGGCGLCWSQHITPIGANGMLCFDHELGDLRPGQEMLVEPITVAHGTFFHWQEFRQFALKQAGVKAISEDSLEVLANGGNPFVDRDYELTLQDLKNVPFSGQVEARTQGGVYGPTPIADEKITLQLPTPGPGELVLVRVEADTEAVLVRRQLAIFGIGGEVNFREGQTADLDVMTVDNGAVRLSAAHDFGPALYSLEYQGRQWLDSSFPTPRPNSWWNPWLGGSSLDVENLSQRSLLREPRTTQFVSRADNVGNLWQGLHLQVEVQEHEKFQGLKLSQYILTLPGLAGLCMFAQLEHSGMVIEDVECLNEVFLAPGGIVEGSWADTVTPQGKAVRYKQGGGLQSPMVRKLLYGSSACPERLLTFSTTDTDIYTNKEVMVYGSFSKITLVPGEQVITAPQFLLFVQEDIPAPALEPLTKIRF